MTSLSFTLFGEPTIVLDGIPLTESLPQKALTLFYYLAAEPKIYSRAELANLLWGETKQPRVGLRGAIGAIQHSESNLAQFLEDSDQNLTLIEALVSAVDVRRFRELIDAEELPQLEEAINLYQGEFLEGLSISGTSDGFDIWLISQRETLRKVAIKTCERLVNEYMAQEQFAQALPHAQKLAEIDPMNEEPHLWVMRLFALTSQAEEALSYYPICCRILQGSGYGPSKKLEELYHQIQRGNLSQLIPTSPPPDLSSQKAAPFQVPGRNAYFVPRQELIEKMAERLTLPASGNLHALVGMHGIGKTSLAIMLGHELRSVFPGGVLWADASTTDRSSILNSWGQAYGYDFSHISSIEAKAAAVRDMLSNRRVLIILDDVTDGERAQMLLPTGDDCVVLMTTRDHFVADALNARPEFLDAVPEAEGMEILASFLDNEQRFGREEEEARAICQLVENLPLALEIVGKRLRRPPEQRLSDMLAQLQETQNSLASFEHGSQGIRTSFLVSYEALASELQALFATLSLFEGRTFSRDAIAFITEADGNQTEEQLKQLSELSLVSATTASESNPAQYRQHALLTAYGREQLEKSSKFQIYQSRMVDYYCRFAQVHRADYLRLEDEWSNIQATFQLVSQIETWSNVFDLTDALGKFWLERGRFAEARTGYQSACSGAEALGEQPRQATYLCGWAQACLEQTDEEECRSLLGQGLQVCDSFSNDADTTIDKPLIEILYTLGRLEIEQKEFGQGEAHLRRCVELCRKTADRGGEAKVLYLLADIPYYQKEFDEAASLGSKARKIQKEIGDKRGQIQSLGLLADIAIEEKKYALASRYCEEALDLCGKINDNTERAVILYTYGEAQRNQGLLSEAHNSLAEGLQLLERMGDRRTQTRVILSISKTYLAQQQYDLALEQGLLAQLINNEIGNRWGEVYTLENLSNIYQQQGDQERAEGYRQAALDIAQEFDKHPRVSHLQVGSFCQ